MHSRKFGVFAASARTTPTAAVIKVLNPTPTATPTATPVGLPTFETGRDAFHEAYDEGAKAVWELAIEKVSEDHSEPGTLHYAIDLKSEATLDIVTDWCAQTTNLRHETLERFTPIIIVDDRSLALSRTQTFEWEVRPGEDPDHLEGQQCQSWEVLVSDWPVGTRTVTEGWTLDSTINDGERSFAARDYVYTYTITATK
jgi:hypothetical protein